MLKRRHPRAGLRRRYRRASARRFLPRLAIHVHQGRRGAWLAAGDPRTPLNGTKNFLVSPRTSSVIPNCAMTCAAGRGFRHEGVPRSKSRSYLGVMLLGFPFTSKVTFQNIAWIWPPRASITSSFFIGVHFIPPATAARSRSERGSAVWIEVLMTGTPFFGLAGIP
jgi:hypothetical protein